MIDLPNTGRNDAELHYSNAISVLILADDAAGLANASDAAEAVGASARRLDLSATFTLPEDPPVGVDAVMIELSEPGMFENTFLQRVIKSAEHDNLPIVVNVRMELLDEAIHTLAGPCVEIVCNASSPDRIATLGIALGTKRLMLNDVTADLESARLKRLADEVGRIAQALAQLTPQALPTRAPSQFNDMMIGFAAEPILPPIDAEQPTARQIRNIIRRRRLREQYFAQDLFADPAWDMLLDLMAARLEGHQIAVSSLCIAASVPPTTALRWIKLMTDNGMFVRCSDPADGRRIFVELSEQAAGAMSAYLAASSKVGRDF